MIDIIHFLFEEDMSYVSGEQAEGQSKMRSSLYGELYGRAYNYGYKKQSTPRVPPGFEDDFPLETEAPIQQFSAKDKPTKAFIPPTQIDPDSAMPFGNSLDAPLR